MFSKTRIFYYDNQPSISKIDDTSDLTIERPQPDAGYNYLSVRYPGTTHNWSYIPVNAYGLYCTFAEIQALVENNDSFTPKEIEITVGHTIPLARYPSTANSTQLSFNNTIYSLIACEEDGYIGLSSYLQDGEVVDFIRTFDGVSASDATTRSSLPKRDWWFRIPYHELNVTNSATAPTNVNYTVPLSATSLTAKAIPTTNLLDYGMNIKQLIDSYIPELLQNNDEIYTLYPGENQYQKNITSFDDVYCTLDVSGTCFNETLYAQDQRLNCMINRTITGRSAANVLSLPVIFNLRGNNNDFVPSNLNSDFETTDTLALQRADLNKLFDIYYNRRGGKDYTPTLPKIFIKGVPIVDGDNNLVPHTFCCTITWTLKVETVPRSNMNTNRLQWRMTYPYLHQSITDAGAIVSTYAHMGNFAKKPFKTTKMRRNPHMKFNNLTNAQLTTGYTRALKINKLATPGDIIKSDANSPDDVSPSTFGFSMPFTVGLYEGHAFFANSPVP